MSTKRNEYVFIVFLLTEASIGRITFAFLQEGYGVRGWYRDGDMVHRSNSISATAALLISDELGKINSVDEAAQELNKILTNLKVPYFGSVASKANEMFINHGNIPFPKK